MSIQKITVPGLARLPAFCHATIAGDFIYVSGTLGTKPDSLELVDGGTAAQTTATMRHLRRSATRHLHHSAAPPILHAAETKKLHQT